MATPITASEAAQKLAEQERVAIMAARRPTKMPVLRHANKSHASYAPPRKHAAADHPVNLFGLTQPTVGWADYRAWLPKMAWSTEASRPLRSKPFIAAGYRNPATVDEPPKSIAPDFDERVTALSKAGL